MGLADFLVANDNALLVLVFIALGLLGAGYVAKGPRSHWLRIAGWVAFGLYWPTQIPKYLAVSDPTNASFCALAPFLTGYVAFHEWRNLKWAEDPPALRWIAGSTFIAAGTYFLIYRIPAITDKLIQFTTWQSAIATRYVYGVDASYGLDAWGNWNIYINGQEYAVTVILACTAVQSMAIFAGAIATIKAPGPAKWKALAVSVVPIYFLNLWRNASIVWGYKVLQWNPFAWGPVDTGSPLWIYYPTFAEGSFVWMHSVIGKYGSLLALVLIALAVFHLLPELHGAILDLFDLRKPHKPGFFNPPKPPQEAPAGKAREASGVEGRDLDVDSAS